MSNPNLSRVLGWALLVFSILSISTEYAAGRAISFVYVVTLSVSFWLMVRATGLLEEGDTTTRLRMQAMHGRTTHATSEHLSKRTATIKKTMLWRFQQRIASEYVLTLIVSLSLAVVLAGAAIFLPLLFVALTTSAAVYLILLGMLRKSVLTICVAQVIGAALLFNAGQWFGVDTAYSLEQNFVNVLACMLVITSLFCLGNIARTYQNHIAGRLVVINAFLFYISVATGLVTSGKIESLGLTLLTFAAACGPAASFAWIRFGRNSFAKYLATAAVLAVLAFAYLYMSAVAITLIWFIATVTYFMFGFGLPSYSARMMGLTLLAGTTTNYVLLLVPSTERIAGDFWMQESFWLGGFLGIFMLLVAGWYNALVLKGMEAQLRPYIRHFLLLGAYLIATLSIMVVTTGLFQSLALSLLGMIGALLGIAIKSRWTVIGGAVITVLALLNFLIITGASL